MKNVGRKEERKGNIGISTIGDGRNTSSTNFGQGDENTNIAPSLC